MGISISKPGPPSDAHRLYDVIGEEARALGFASRMALFAAMKDARPFETLNPDLRAVFVRAATKLQGGRR